MPGRPARGITLVEMLIVVAIVGLIAGISFPAVSSGIDSLRLSSASDSLVSFLNGALNRSERRQQVVQISISIEKNAVYLNSPDLARELDMPTGITIEAVRGPSLFLLLPGATVPRVGIQIVNRKGARRIVRVNPMTGVPEIERVEAQAP
jgi:prepilin-type N-terminal cleavage/methylation domain-containing protein